jgi:hypothetical protein
MLSLAIAACSRPPLTAADLRLPDGSAGFAVVEARYVLTDDGRTTDRAIELMRRAKIASAAEYFYQPAPPAAGSIKVRVELFVDDPAAQANWKTRHRPEALAMTRPFDAGDTAWIYRDQMAGVRVGRAIFEFRAKGAVAGFVPFCRAYAQFAQKALRH